MVQLNANTMKNNLNKQFNIPNWVKGDTIADESNSVMKRFEGRNDNASNRTKEAILKSLSENINQVLNAILVFSFFTSM